MPREPAPPDVDASTERSSVLASTAPQQWAPSFFGVVSRRSIRRRPSDAIQLVGAVLLVVACVWSTDGFTGRGTSMYRTLADLPGWLGSIGTFVFVVCTVGAVAVVLLALVSTRNFRLTLTLVVVGGSCTALAVGLRAWVDGDAVRDATGPASVALSANSVVWLAVTISVLQVAGPFVVRPARRLLRTVTMLAIGGAIITAIGPLAAILAAVGVGWGFAALVSLVIGTPKATPTVSSVEDALRGLGIAITDLELAEEQTWGETRFVGQAPDGTSASVVVIGRDAADARLAHRLWRSALYRDAGPTVSVSRSAQLEHRAYLLLLAAKSGVPVSSVVMAATAGTDDIALLAMLEPTGRRWSEVPADELDDDVLDGAWSTIERLHAARLSHGGLSPSNLILQPDRTTALVGVSRGSAGATPERCDADRVDLLVSTAALVGNERALAAAERSLGAGGLGGLLPLVQTAALSAPTRRVVPETKKWLKTLREDGAARTGQEAPGLTPLRRVSAGSVAMAAMTFVGFYLIVNQFAGVDLSTSLAQAEWGWVLVAFALAFVPQFSGAIALMGSVGSPLPFGPVLAEQFANNFTGLIGGTVATTALVIRFFQKQGLKVAVAASSGMMNAIAGSIVQLVLVIIGLVFTGSEFVPSSAGGGGNLEQVVLIGIVVAGVAVTVALVVPKLRVAVKRTVKPQVDAAWVNLRVILTDPRKALMIFGGNLCSQVFYALVIDAALRAYGVHVPLLQLVVINSLASFLGGMAPVPGGMGVIEAGLIGGMTAAGVPKSEAVAATFTARLFTSYLPPIWGWVSLQWLRRHDYV